MNEVIQRIENVVLDANCSRWEDIFVPHVEYFKKKNKEYWTCPKHTFTGLKNLHSQKVM